VIKSEKIPEDIRSAVMNIFRIPLNAFVVLLLLKIKFLSSQVVFLICTLTHLMALLCYGYFYMYCGKSAVVISGASSSEKVTVTLAYMMMMLLVCMYIYTKYIHCLCMYV
jgi:hypothetical protein